MHHLLNQIMAKAIQSFHSGALDEAEKLFKEALKIHSKNFDALHILGVIKGIKNQHNEALEYFKKALRINPNNSFVNFNVAKAFAEIGDHEKAIKYHLISTKLNPSAPEAWLSYGTTLSILNRESDALKAIENALNLDPNYADAWIQRGVALEQINSHNEAITAFEKALQINPQSALAWYNLGNSQQEIQEFEQSIASYNNAIQINHEYADAWYNCGNALLNIKKLKESIVAYDKALAINPQLAQAWVNRGYALFEIKLIEQSLASCDMALKIDPNLASAWSNRGNALLEIKKFNDAITCYETALQINPQIGRVWANLAFAQINTSQFEQSIASYREAIRLEPDNLTIRNDFLLNINYIEKFDVDVAFAEAQAFGSLVSERSTPKFTNWDNECKPEILNIGFVSGDFCNHPVGYFIEGLVASLDPTQFKLYAFSNQSTEDDLTDRIKSFFSEWIPIHKESDFDAANLIHNKNIHILFDLSGHTALNRLPVFSYKPAPVQASWLGYFATTGLNEIDYFLSDPHMSTASDDVHFTETIWRLPETWLCSKPPSYQLSISALPAASNGFVTYGSFGNLSKLNNQVLEAWVSVLRQVPQSKLFLKSKQLADVLQVDRIRQLFNVHGIPSERLILEGPETREAYLTAYNKVDIILDTFPYPGGTTSVDALFMGVPFVTLRGDRFLSRLGESIAINAGNSDWIANDINEYINKAVDFASNFERLADHRSSLRTRVLNSPLFNVDQFANNFGEALWGMWFKSFKSPSL